MKNNQEKFGGAIFWGVVSTAFFLFLAIWTQNGLDPDKDKLNLIFYGCLSVISLICTILFLYRFNQQRNLVNDNNIGTKDGHPDDLEHSENLETISMYGAVLEYRKSDFSKESDLPYPKEIIEKVLIEELKKSHKPEFLNALEVGYISLSTFINENDYNEINKIDSVFNEIRFNKESLENLDKQDAIGLANRIAEAGTQKSLLIKEQILKDQNERVKTVETIKNTGN